MTAVLLRMPSRLTRAMLVAGLVAIFSLAGSLTVAMADDPTSEPAVEASPAPAADAEPSSATSATAPTLPSPASGGGKEASLPAGGIQPSLATPNLTLPLRGAAKEASAQAGGTQPSVLDRVETVIMAPVQTAVAGHAGVAAFFQPRPWLVAVFLGFTIAIVAMLAAGFRERRQLARI